MEENDNNFLKDKIIIYGECPVCLDNVKQYKGFYKCTHSLCFFCYKKMSSIYCPLCRSI